MGGAVKALCAAVEDELGCAVRTFLDMIVPKAKNGPALRFEEAGSAVVIFSGFGVLAAIQLDRELRFAAGEVDDEGIDYAPPREAGTIVAQAQPEEALRLG